ncbi:MAG TPA: M1 family metallopeptidase [Gemmatimonadaceae bacterium]|nr:M1 family metallopeptidase [Gemmatimonadaceae bacterium]
MTRLPRSFSAILGLLAFAACSRPQQPQVLTPVRLELPGGETNAQRPAARTVADDPFLRIDGLDWPGPNEFRSADGSPGPRYWQQRADYTIDVALDTAAQTVSGDVTIRYTNNSPDTLHYVWLQLDQNLYRPGSKGSTLYPADSRWGVRGFEGGYELTDVRVNGKSAAPRVDDTMMRLDLAQPLAPGGKSVTLSMSFRFRVPEHGSDRMGRDGTLYEIAQWYPRMAVFDDVRGWNTDPYYGQGEFYLEYGDIDYAVTAPTGYTVAGTGTLQNAGEVLTAAQRARLERASGSSSVVPIITADEVTLRAVAGTKTWRFRARNVRDVAWAAAPDFRWDATSWNGVLTQAYYPWPKAGKAWESAAEQTQWSIRTYSELFFPYPYPQATSVAGPVGGMEYPMFVMVHYGNDDPRSIFGTIDHEHGHEWFPMIVGSNERRYGWQDEGFNSFINAFSNERRYPGSSSYPGYVANWRAVAAAGNDAPLMTPPDRIHPAALGALAYRKPAAVLLTLRNAVLGPERFDRAFREYIDRWAFRHPTPADFFRTMENSTGEDLSWYWRAFWYSTEKLDVGVARASTKQVDGDRFAQIELHRTSSVPFPVSARLKLADGSTQDVRFPVQVWGPCTSGDDCRAVTASAPVRADVVGVRLWTGATVPDWDPSNDAWGDAPGAVAQAPSTTGGLAGPIAP